MSRSRPALVALAAAGLVAASVAAAPAATADAPGVTPIATGFVAPFHLAFGPGSSLYVADSFAAQVVRLDLRSGARSIALQGMQPVHGVDVLGNGNILTAHGIGDPSFQPPTYLKRTNASGRTTTVANLLDFERANNPDGQPLDTPDSQSNPYSVLALPGRTLVADAGANDIVEVRANGATRALVALPTFTGEGCPPNNDGVASCDPVPTDLELGPDGYLYVSGLGAEVEGHIYKVNARTGAIVQTWGGFPPLTGIAVAPDGTIYAASIFASTVFRIGSGGVTTASVPTPTDVEWGHGMLVAASWPFGPGGAVYRVSASAFG